MLANDCCWWIASATIWTAELCFGMNIMQQQCFQLCAAEEVNVTLLLQCMLGSTLQHRQFCFSLQSLAGTAPSVGACGVFLYFFICCSHCLFSCSILANCIMATSQFSYNIVGLHHGTFVEQMHELVLVLFRSTV